MLTSTTHFNKVYANAHMIGRSTRVVSIDKFFVNFPHSNLQQIGI